MEQRKTLLYEALQAANISPRTDSKMCEAFIGGEPFILGDVVHVMAVHQWLYHHTDYPTTIGPFLEKKREVVIERYPCLAWYQVQQIVQQVYSPGLKYEYLSRLPERWPWETQAKNDNLFPGVKLT